MTLAQLQSQVARLIGLGNIADDPDVQVWVTDALNQAQHEIASDLQIPRVALTIPATLSPVSLPPTTQSWGVLAVYDSTNDNPLAIVDEARGASEGFPSGAPGVPRMAIYSHSANQLILYPVPVTPVDLYILVATIPADMVNPTDQPWDGQYPEYHYLVALKASLLIHESDWADPKRVEWVMQRYALRLQGFRQRIEAQKDAKPRSEVELHDTPRA